MVQFTSTLQDTFGFFPRSVQVNAIISCTLQRTSLRQIWHPLLLNKLRTGVVSIKFCNSAFRCPSHRCGLQPPDGARSIRQLTKSFLSLDHCHAPSVPPTEPWCRSVPGQIAQRLEALGPQPTGGCLFASSLFVKTLGSRLSCRVRFRVMNPRSRCRRDCLAPLSSFSRTVSGNYC